MVEFVKNKAKNSNGISSINPYIPIKDQELSKEVEAILGMIHEEYLNEDNEED